MLPLQGPILTHHASSPDESAIPHFYNPIPRPALNPVPPSPRVFFSANSVHPTEVIPLYHTVLPILVSRRKVLR